MQHKFNDEATLISDLNEALHWVKVSKLQIARYVENLLLAAESNCINTTGAIADGHFLLNALAQSGKALRRVSLSLPEERTS